MLQRILSKAFDWKRLIWLKAFDWNCLYESVQSKAFNRKRSIESVQSKALDPKHSSSITVLQWKTVPKVQCTLTIEFCPRVYKSKPLTIWIFQNNKYNENGPPGEKRRDGSLCGSILELGQPRMVRKWWYFLHPHVSCQNSSGHLKALLLPDALMLKSTRTGTLGNWDRPWIGPKLA